MAAMAGVLNRALASAQAPQGTSAGPLSASPAATAADSSAGGTSATISSNDFLTLLVTEMQNQDPTAQTDPNEYIDQLVQVNSLEQLISINQNLQTVLGTASGMAGSGAGVSSAVQAPAAAPPGTAPGPAPGPASGAAQAIGQFAQAVTARRAQGNLSIPEAHAAARKVAHALDGHARTSSTPGKQAGAMKRSS